MKEKKSYLVRKAIDTVGQIIHQRPYLTFNLKETIEYIVREMQTGHYGAVGVINNDNNLVGMLTERDILRAIFGTHGESDLAHDKRHHKLSVYPETLTAQDVMVRNPICLFEDMPVETALENIKDYGFRFMPVVKREDRTKLTGIVSERELFWHTQEKNRRMMAKQNTLISYFMHHEPYGDGGDIPIDVKW